jgi:uncharacterized membrane protein YesL
VTKLAYVNGLWMLFSLVGFIVVGFFPATVAMMTICRMWLNGESEIPIFKTFVKTYKSALISSNLLGWILAGVGVLLYINFLVLQANTGQINIVTVSVLFPDHSFTCFTSFRVLSRFIIFLYSERIYYGITQCAFFDCDYH